MLERLPLLQVLTGLADHHPELDFPVGLLAPQWDLDIVVGTDDRTGRLQEKWRLVRNGHFRFGRVVGIIESHADNLAHSADAGTEARRTVDSRETLRIDRPKRVKRLRQKRRTSEVTDGTGEVA